MKQFGWIWLSPREIALTNIVKDKMKIIKDALPIKLISFLITCCPTNAAMAATMVK